MKSPKQAAIDEMAALSIISGREQHAGPASLDPTGRALEAAVLDAARLYGWRVAHFRPARTLKGWRTPVQGDKGWVDFVLARQAELGEPGRLVMIETKAGMGRLSADQRAWRDVLRACPGVEWYQVGDEWLVDDGDGNELTRVLR